MVNSTCCPFVLILGDSVDRYAVEDFCKSRKNHSENWSGNIFRNRRKNDSEICFTIEGTIAHLHIFGSNATGPYFKNISNTPSLIDTKPRLLRGIQLFSQRFGPPAVIVLHVMLWDFFKVMDQGADELDREAAGYRASIFERILEILTLKDNRTALVLRTAPLPDMTPTNWLLARYNGVVRNISAQLGLELVDLDELVWGGGVRADRLWAHRRHFRDAIHPRPHHCVHYAERLLELGRRRLGCGSATVDAAGPSNPQP